MGGVGEPRTDIPNAHPPSQSALRSPNQPDNIPGPGFAVDGGKIPSVAVCSRFAQKEIQIAENAHGFLFLVLASHIKIAPRGKQVGGSGLCVGIHTYDNLYV